MFYTTSLTFEVSERMYKGSGKAEGREKPK